MTSVILANVQTESLTARNVFDKIPTEFPRMRVLIDERGSEFQKVGVLTVGLQ